MARAHFVKSARKNNKELGIKKGDSYYWWQFRYGPKHASKTPPRPSQLTQSAFLSTWYGLQERIQDGAFRGLETIEDLESVKDEIYSEIEDLKSETEGNLDNMPDGLKEGDTGQLLQERIDGLDGVLSELDSVDISLTMGEVKEDLDAKRVTKEVKERYKERLDEIADELESAIDNASF